MVGLNAGGKTISPSFSETLIPGQEAPKRSLHKNLSDREFQILSMFTRGKSLKDIAESLCINDKTVST